MKKIHLHIDRITVDGLSATEQRRFARALEAQLLALADEGGAGAIVGGQNRVIRSASPGELAPGASANRAAAQVANSIRQSLTGRGHASAHSRGGEARRDG
jgi:hypothetical protein